MSVYKLHSTKSCFLLEKTKELSPIELKNFVEYIPVENTPPGRPKTPLFNVLQRIEPLSRPNLSHLRANDFLS